MGKLRSSKKRSRSEPTMEWQETKKMADMKELVSSDI
jgi:hypothetical protein